MTHRIVLDRDRDDALDLVLSQWAFRVIEAGTVGTEPVVDRARRPHSFPAEFLTGFLFGKAPLEGQRARCGPLAQRRCRCIRHDERQRCEDELWRACERQVQHLINVASTNPNMCGIVGVNACGECGHCHWNENAAYTSRMPHKAVVSRLLDVLR